MVIYVYTGEGAGKTTNAIGLALRTAGHGKKAAVIQFLKWWKGTGEYKIQEKLLPYYQVFQFGREGWHGFGNLTEEDKKLCEQALEFSKSVVKKGLDLLILDEINLAMFTGMLDEKKVLKYLEEMRSFKDLDIVLTGRYAPKRIIEIADVVNEIRTLKEPKEMITKEGINY
ncbi:cob(I)yrinic acid a,c-diamide adenosyltransferase [Candidatus Pacearchaeota archaeon]|nr:cob(I)yrinic acid a,c-diamide adenosyltransferase [Candidatus Pacearchaeota archaeon]